MPAPGPRAVILGCPLIGRVQQRRSPTAAHQARETIAKSLHGKQRLIHVLHLHFCASSSSKRPNCYDVLVWGKKARLQREGAQPLEVIIEPPSHGGR
jgi:hypothetical protein